jgi:LysM repeat protein
VSDRPPNQIARIAAVAGVITMFLLVIVVVAASIGGSSDSGGNESDFSTGSSTVTGDNGSQTTTTAQDTNAIDKGFYIVKVGDTLTGISAATGVDVDTLIQLNPTTDPQTLIAGTKLKLR